MVAWSYHWRGFGSIFDLIGSKQVFDLFRHVDPIYQTQRQSFVRANIKTMYLQVLKFSYSE